MHEPIRLLEASSSSQVGWSGLPDLCLLARSPARASSLPKSSHKASTARTLASRSQGMGGGYSVQTLFARRVVGPEAASNA
eukprot:6195194-Pleurochrysis_carterae.AAC.1